MRVQRNKAIHSRRQKEKRFSDRGRERKRLR